jgi:glycosyltransferase involved in cell wall biosynthesis
LLSDEELDRNFQRSKIILLPYLNSDTFSSGTLIHSLNSNKIVIGPHVGNFIDVSRWGACLTYKSAHDLFKKMEELLSNAELYDTKRKALTEGITRYYNLNSWETFIDNLLRIATSTAKEVKDVIKPSLTE